jgi:hypothetical protein
MRRTKLALIGFLALGFAVTARGDRVVASAVAVSLPQTGTRIDASNVSQYAKLLPTALMFAVAHGLTINVVANQRITWPARYQRDTEQFSAQVTLAPNDGLQHHTAGLPFPQVDEQSPQAGVKVAYNWRFGPFQPRELSLTGDQKTAAYSIDPAHPTRLLPDESNRDYRNENNCEHILFMRIDGSTSGEDRKALPEWKERGDQCGPDRAASITIRYSDPARPDDDYGFIPALRKWREFALQGGYPNQSCTYACTQLFWEYLPPKTEVYSIQLVDKRPMLACIEPRASSAGLIDGENSSRFAQLDCEIRQTYVLDLRPRFQTPERVLSARAYIDAETFLYLSGEFSRDREPDSDVAIWSLQHSPTGESARMLANDFYIPADRPNFVLSLDVESAKLVLDGNLVSNVIFNPRAEILSDGQM